MLENRWQRDFNRRDFIRSAASMAGVATVVSSSSAVVQKTIKHPKGDPTRFQIACMTLVYSQFPLDRALTGLQQAGYHFVAWGTNHSEADGKKTPVVAADAAPERAKDIAQRCRDRG